jgi:DNA-binding winged helix-turn-helix (wHTH) protein
MPLFRGTEGSNPPPSTGESRASLNYDIDIPVPSSFRDQVVARSGTMDCNAFCGTCRSKMTRLLNTAIIGATVEIVTSSRSCAPVALMVVKLCKNRLCNYFGGIGIAAERPGSLLSRCENFPRLVRIGRPLEDDSPVDEETFVFGSLRLVPAQRMLFEDGKPLRIGGRALDILVVLVENAGETIRKGSADRPDLVRYGRRRRCVAGSCRCAAQGAGRAGTRYIANIPGRGYRFIAPVPREQRQRAIAQANGAAVRGNLPALVTRIVGLTEGLIPVVRECV